jgi:spermidine synthase
VEAAGASLLYSREFYELARQRLKPNGVLQAWYPQAGDAATFQAALRSLCDAFPYVRCFASLEGWGAHLIASMEPIEIPSAAELAARMPVAAQHDLLEWHGLEEAADYLEQVLKREFRAEAYLASDPSIRITDDRPFNEYFLLRRTRL